MARYRMDDGTVVDTERATASYEEGLRWDGRNHISLATGSQWHHETLYRSRKGRYYVEHTSNYQGSTPGAEWVSHRAAAQWLTLHGHDLPEELMAVADEATE